MHLEYQKKAVMTTRFPLVLSFACASVLLASCEKQATASPSASQLTDITALQTTVNDDHTSQIKKLQKELRDLEFKVAGLGVQAGTVTADSQSYTLVNTRHGPFTVALVGLTPYLDGYKAKLRIGNMTSAIFKGAKLDASWGPLISAGAEDYFGKRKNKEFDLSTEFKAQSFTEIEVALSPAKPDEVKEIDIGLDFNVVSLRIPN